jgi:SET domain-containing protein
MLHSTIKLTQQSRIHGRGLIAQTPIHRGDVVWRRDLDEMIVHLSEIKQWTKEKQTEFFWIAYQCSEEEFVLPRGIDGYMNHSCDPNTWWADDHTLVARRDIRPGEEVTYDYTTTEIALDFEMDCQCGSPLCRGTISNRDYLNREWQTQYGDHLPGYVLKAVAAAQVER